MQTRLASVRMGMGEPDAAMGDLEHTLELAPKLPQVGEALFFAALATGDMHKTADALAKVKAAEGDTDVVQNLDGLLQARQARLARRTRHVRRHHARNIPTSCRPRSISPVSMPCRARGRTPRRFSPDILAKHPTAEPALTMLATDYTQTNRLPEAIKLLEAAHAAEPANEHLTANLANSTFARRSRRRRSIWSTGSKAARPTAFRCWRSRPTPNWRWARRTGHAIPTQPLLKLDPQAACARVSGSSRCMSMRAISVLRATSQRPALRRCRGITSSCRIT